MGMYLELGWVMEGGVIPGGEMAVSGRRGTRSSNRGVGIVFGRWKVKIYNYEYYYTNNQLSKSKL